MLETVAEGSEHESETSQRISGWRKSLTPPPPIEDEFLEDFGAIRNAETTCVENLTWALLHLKKTIGKKDEKATWQGNRDAVDTAVCTQLGAARTNKKKKNSLLHQKKKMDESHPQKLSG